MHSVFILFIILTVLYVVFYSSFNSKSYGYPYNKIQNNSIIGGYFNRTDKGNSQDESTVLYIRKFAVEKKGTTFKGFDILFLIDATASMSPYIESVKQTIKTIVEDSKKEIIRLKASEDSIRFAIVAYRDHPPQDKSWITSISDFNSAQETLAFLNNLRAQGGGDMPEAVFDGINAALYNVSWRQDSEKSIIMALDSPPHGKRFSDESTYECPSGLHEDKLLPKMREMKIDLSIIKLTDYLDKMITYFSQYINIEIFKSQIFENRHAYSESEYTRHSSEYISGSYSYKYKRRLEEL